MGTLSYPGKFLLQVIKKQHINMAKIVDNPKGFKVVEASRMELACKWVALAFAIIAIWLLILVTM